MYRAAAKKYGINPNMANSTIKKYLQVAGTFSSHFFLASLWISAHTFLNLSVSLFLGKEFGSAPLLATLFDALFLTPLILVLVFFYHFCCC